MAKTKKTLSTPAAKAVAPAIVRTSAGLRAMLFDELDALRNGSTTNDRANSVARLAGSITDNVRMELEVAKYGSRARLPGGKRGALPPPIDLVQP